MDPAIKKKILRKFTYGLYIVTTAHGDDHGAFTANWLVQSSFEPPMITIAVEQDAHSRHVLEAGGVFAVHALRADQRELAGAIRIEQFPIREPHRSMEIRQQRTPGKRAVLHGYALFRRRDVQSHRVDGILLINCVPHGQVTVDMRITGGARHRSIEHDRPIVQADRQRLRTSGTRDVQSRQNVIEIGGFEMDLNGAAERSRKVQARIRQLHVRTPQVHHACARVVRRIDSAVHGTTRAGWCDSELRRSQQARRLLERSLHLHGARNNAVPRELSLAYRPTARCMSKRSQPAVEPIAVHIPDLGISGMRPPSAATLRPVTSTSSPRKDACSMTPVSGSR